MLYNPAWSKTQLLDNWIGFLEAKDPKEGYEWRYPAGCALGQWYGNAGWIGLPYFSTLDSISRGQSDASKRRDWTFGACLERAKKYREGLHLGWFNTCG